MRNKFERRIHKSLKKAKARFGYETEKLPYVLAKHYIPDFVVETKAGKIYIECKGYLRPGDRSKLAAVKRQHRDKDIRIVFYSSSRTNIKWAERNGFVYSIGQIPKEWLQ